MIINYILKPFYMMAKYLVIKYHKKIYKENVRKYFSELYLQKQVPQRLLQYYTKKLGVIIFVLFAGTIIALGYAVTDCIIDKEEKENRIERHDPGGEDYEITMQMKTEEESISFPIVVKARSLTYEEADKKAGELMSLLPDLICSEKDVNNRVTNDLHLVSTVSGYPFQIYWKMEDNHIIRQDGKLIKENIAAEGTNVTLGVSFIYDENIWEDSISLVVFREELPEEERRIKNLSNMIEGLQEESKYENSFLLPEIVDGTLVTWSREKENRGVYIWILFLGGVLIWGYLQDARLQKQVEKRHIELIGDYPEFINKLALYLSTGIPLKSAWIKIVKGYDTYRIHNNKNKKYVYEEMKIACRELENGVEEGEVYYRFGIRCFDLKYRKLTSLLIANLQKGNDKILIKMRTEAEIALEERKNQARIQGEKAGTKLLLPMMIMLIIVMLIIMIPAYGSFGV